MKQMLDIKLISKKEISLVKEEEEEEEVGHILLKTIYDDLFKVKQKDQIDYQSDKIKVEYHGDYIHNNINYDFVIIGTKRQLTVALKFQKNN